MTIKDLVKSGYFPEELLPVFSTEELADSLPKIIPLLAKYIKKRPVSKLLPFSIPKAKGYRRNLSIPNPLQYIQLAKTIAENWDDIQAHTEKSKISISRLNPGGPRAIKKFKFDDFIDERLHRSVGSRYLLKIDITRFYNSIYTHSIPWAIHTKAVTKVERSRKIHFGNGLDQDCRNTQDGQTIGLPIGPDTSRIISEVILAAVDKVIQKSIPGLQGIRIIDDYYLYFKTIAEVEIARSIIHKTLHEYELELNPNKEAVIEIPEIIESNWYRELKGIRFSNDATKQRKELIAFFDVAFMYAKKNPEDAVLSYAISKIKPTIFKRVNTRVLVSLLVNALIQEPKIISQLSEILTSYDKSRHPLNKTLLSAALNEFILFHCLHNNDYEIAWALWTIKNLKLKLTKNTANQVSENRNSIIALVSLDLKRSGCIPAGLNTKIWRSMLTAENLYTESWLLAYEAKVKGWLRTADDYISTDPFFNQLKTEKVRFYNPKKKLDISRVKVSTSDSSVSGYEDDEEEEKETPPHRNRPKRVASTPTQSDLDDEWFKEIFG